LSCAFLRFYASLEIEVLFEGFKREINGGGSMLTDIDITAFLEKKKSGNGFLVLTTGSSCCGRKEIFLPELEKLCKEKGKKIKIYNVGSEIFKFIWEGTRVDVPPENVLYANKMAMYSTQYGIFKDLSYRLPEDLKKYDLVIVNLHARFYWWWGSVPIPIYNEPFINLLMEKGLKPDLLICFIDNALNTVERLNQSSQWKDQRIDETCAYLWQHEEVNATRGYLFLTKERINFFVMPVMQPPETLYYILFEPWRPIIYAQMPITNIGGKDLKKAIHLIEEIRKDGVVFSPLTIETGIVEKDILTQLDENKQVIVRHIQTGYRDDEWFIPQCRISLAFHMKVVFTFGVVDETVHTAQLGRDAWSIFPQHLSPFQPFRISKIFETTDACLEFFQGEFMPEIWKKWNVPKPKKIKENSGKK
jgi:hypothetical protein